MDVPERAFYTRPLMRRFLAAFLFPLALFPAVAEIAKRAYEIWQSGKGGSQTENWLRAERELRGATGR